MLNTLSDERTEYFINTQLSQASLFISNNCIRGAQTKLQPIASSQKMLEQFLN
ncbi:hypothetical protein [Commensalibacter sp. Nvir]|uniref:hypothetical protein n=1 Tax=Commensalibacter sp. Nvir TaxID=3069817 RepID=UPI0030C810D4